MRQVLILGILCVTGVALADVPFAPRADVPDYAVTMVRRDADSPQQAFQTVLHHGNWTRVDDGAGTNSNYFARHGVLAVGISRSRPDATYVTLTRNRAQIGWDTEPRNTAERQTVLGESCTVWDVRRTRDSSPLDYRLTQLACITDDGIELWSRSVRNDEVLRSDEATHVERRPVATDDVQPPQDLLTLGWWDSNEPASPSNAVDFEAVMELSGETAGTAKSVRTIRRHHPWRYEEERAGTALRRLEISHASTRQSLWFNGFAGNAEKRLTIQKIATPLAPPPPGLEPRDLERGETVLGQDCRWFESTPGMADTGKTECRTPDGIPLKQVEWSRSFRRVWTAVRADRRAVSPDEVKPPGEIMSLDWWTKE